MITTKTILMMMAEDNFYDDDDEDDDDIFESRWRRHIGKECSRIWAAAKFTFNVPLLFVISIVISVIIWGSKLWKRGGSVADFVLQFRRKPTQPLPSLPKLLPSLSSSIIIISSSLHRSIVVCLRHLSNLVFIASWSRFSGLFLDILISMHWSNPRKRQLISRLFFIIEPFTATTPKDYMIEIQT